LIKLLTSGSNIKLTNKGKQVRDFLHVYALSLLIDSNSKISYLPGNDYGFAFSNKVSIIEFNWEPEILFQERLPIIKKNLAKGISALNKIIEN
jgi:hypothetical protein